MELSLTPRELHLLMDALDQVDAPDQGSCPRPDVAASLAGALGAVSIPDQDLQEIVDALGRGGEAGMAIALSIMRKLAEADAGVQPPALTKRERAMLTQALESIPLAGSPRLRNFHSRLKSPH
jgi:hypothetical protein